MGDLGLLGMHLEGLRLRRPQRRRVRADRPGTGGRRLRPADLRLRAGVAGDERASTSTAPRSRSSSGCPGMAKGELIGCFGLTEPTAGSDPGGMTTYARRDGSDWVLTGAKRWIGLASIAAGRGDLGADRRGDPRVRRADRDPGFHRDPDRAEAVDAGLHPVRHHPGRRAAARGRGAAERGRPEGPVRLPERGPLRDHLGRHGRGPGLLRGRAALQPAARTSSTSRSPVTSSPSASSSTWCWRSRRASWSRCRPAG